MSVQSQIDRIEQNVANTYAVLAGLGADMPTEQNSDNLAETAGSTKAVLYSEQTLTDEQKAQVRNNIDAIGIDELAYVTPQMYGAKADGVTDDTKAINDAIEAVGNGGTVFFPDGTYLVKENETTVSNNRYAILVNNKKDITLLLSSGAVIQHATSTSAFYRTILIKESNNITVKGGYLIGDLDTHTPEYRDGYDGIVNTHGYGIRMIDSTNLVIDGVELSKYYGDPLIICSEQNPYNGCQGVVIKNCKIHDSSRNGITVTSCQGLIVQDCEIYNITGALPMAGIDIEGEYSGAVNKDILIDCCNIHDNGKLSMALALTCEDVHIKNSILHPRFSMSENAKNIEISDCIIYNPTVSNVIVKNSIVRDAGLNAGNSTFIGCRFIADEESMHNVCISNAGANGRFIGCEFMSSEVQNHTFYAVRGNAQAKLVSFSDCTFHLRPIRIQPFGNIGVSQFIGCTFVAELEDQATQWVGISGTDTVFNGCVFDVTKISTYTTGYSGLIKIDTTNVVVKDCLVKALSKLSKYAFNIGSNATGEVYFINNVVDKWDSVGAMPSSASKLLLSGNVLSTSESEVKFTEEDKEKLDNIDDIISNSGFITEEEAKGYTDSKVANVAAQASKQAPLFATKVEDCTDTTKVYVLPDGNIYGYMMTEKEVDSLYTNLLPTATDSDRKTIYGGDYDGDGANDGYLKGVRLSSSSGTTTSATNVSATGYISAKEGDIVRIKGANSAGSTALYVLAFDSSNAKIGGAVNYDTGATSATIDKNGYTSDGTIVTVPLSSVIFGTEIDAIRVSFGVDSTDVIITINEEIKEGTGIIKEYAWVDTGHSFITTLDDDIPINVATEGDISNHNNSLDAHPDIRELLNNIELSDEQLASAIADYITKNPITGASGRGIVSTKRTSGTGAAGTTDTYTITYTDGTTSTFTVYNGANGSNGTNGTNGTNGKSAYQYAQSGGYTGTEAAFTTALAKIPSYTTETWTFTLEGGSTVTKAVVLG